MAARQLPLCFVSDRDRAAVQCSAHIRNAIWATNQTSLALGCRRIAASFAGLSRSGRFDRFGPDQIFSLGITAREIAASASRSVSQPEARVELGMAGERFKLMCCPVSFYKRPPTEAASIHLAA
jgi:hypothetical protein